MLHAAHKRRSFLPMSVVAKRSPISAAAELLLYSSRQCRRACAGVSLPVKISPSHVGSGLHLIHAFLGTSESITQAVSRSVQPLCAAHGRVWSEMSGHALPLTIAPSHGGSESPYNTWLLVPARLNTPNGISIGLAVYAQLTVDSPYTLQWIPSP